MDNIVIPFLLNLSTVMMFMFAGWIISLVIKKASIADRMWGLGFVLVAWLSFYQSDGFLLRKILLTALVSVWGLRLFLHITSRSWGKDEDPRYAAWRNEHGDSFWLVSLFKVFIIQGVFLFVISLNMQFGIFSVETASITITDIIGTLVWFTGFTIEVMADRQLNSFLKNPDNRGKIMNRQLWSLSRHPNYFGESMQWWGIYIIVLSCPFGFVTVISPMLITYSLLKVSGVTMMESVEFSDNPEYQKYVKETNAFIPWPRKKK